MEIIARVYTDFPEKLASPAERPRGRSGARVVFEPAYRSPEALRGLEGFSTSG